MTSMKMPTNEIADSLQAAFADTPVQFMAACPLQQKEIAIFPVRYALDEAPEAAGEPGPNPIPDTWKGHRDLPVLHNRTYTLRQLRNGWLYVFDQTTETLDEYRVEGAGFQKITSEDGNGGQAEAFLLYPRDHDLRMAYSSVRWTDYTRERMADKVSRERWMRRLDLADYSRSMQALHCAPLKVIADHVADIDVGAAQAVSRFGSTMLPTQADDTDRENKPALGSDSLLGGVPDQDSALFVALDDPLGILEDLSMQAAGPAQALAMFEEQHMHRLTVAQYVEMLSGADFSELQTMLALSPDDFHKFKQKAQRYLDTVLLRQFDGVTGGTVGLWNASEERAALAEEYGEKVVSRVDELTDQWRARDPLRAQVRFEEAQQFVLEKQAELDALQTSLTVCLEDLIVWLEHVQTNTLAIFHDQTDEAQSLSLLEHADAWLGLLSQHETGRAWFIKEYAEPSTLLGLAHYNFDEELASAIDRIAQEYTEQGTLNLELTGSVAKRAQELAGVLSNETIRNSAIFQRLARPTQRAYDTLLKVASQHFEDLWESFEYKLLPAVSAKLGPQWKPVRFIAITVAVQSIVDEYKPYVVVDPEYEQKHARWSRRVLIVSRKLEAQTRVMKTGRPHDQRAAARDVGKLKRELEKLTLEMPARILARGVIHTQTITTEYQQRLIVIETLGRAEFAQQLEAKAREYGGYIKRVNDWVKSNAAKGLTGLITILNIWNFHTAMADAGASGEWTRNDQLAVGNAATTMLSGLVALTMMPLWAKLSQLAGEVVVEQKRISVRLVDAAARYWAPDYSQHKRLFRTFSSRAIVVSGLALIATIIEARQIWGDISASRSETEKLLHMSKLGAVVLMGVPTIAQLGSATIGLFGGAAAGAIFAPWIVIGLAVTGVIYLMLSVIAQSIKLEGMKLWLQRSSWAKSSTGYWPDTEEGNKDELRALQEVLLRPTVLARTRVEDNSPDQNGVWLKILLPPDLAGHRIEILPIMIREGGWFRSDREATYRAGMYTGYFSDGNWVPLGKADEWSSFEMQKLKSSAPAEYHSKDWRVWLVHVPRTRGMDRMELEIRYPPGYDASA
ncbi:T6SS effector BTH_I2691 family protein [Halopseudomonas pertucinogena]|uniref:Membrane protein n=1 Tax=Halopseudomonas pertucinogena TaxID=86175 RepID=A0ABQ2CP88_9GAMM|nr:T6SS effector BTH_I2691 family protein [Halopseudomonas pertucinogena]GGI99727.1 membrane protein [Halopseudomonas pertucinogena]